MPLDLTSAADAAAGIETPIPEASAAPIEPVVEAASPAAAAAASQPAATSAAAVASATPAAAPAAWTLRQELQKNGMQGDWQDDQSAWTALTNQLQQREQQFQRAQQIAQYYLANKEKFDAALQPAPAPQAPAAAAAPKEDWWGKSDWKPEYERFLTFDDKGQPQAMAGADPTLPWKYQQHRQWQKEKLESLISNPIEAIKPGLEQMIEAKAQELIQKHLGQFEDKQFATNYVTQSADWMYEKTNGQRAIDALGQPILSAAGQKFAGYVRYADELGIKDTRKQQALAEQLTQADALRAWYAQSGQKSAGVAPVAPPVAAAPALTPEQQNDVLKRAAVAGKGANRLPASGSQGGAGPAGAAGDLQSQDIRLSLGNRLSKSLKQAGVE